MPLSRVSNNRREEDGTSAAPTSSKQVAPRRRATNSIKVFILPADNWRGGEALDYRQRLLRKARLPHDGSRRDRGFVRSDLSCLAESQFNALTASRSAQWVPAGVDPHHTEAQLARSARTPADRAPASAHGRPGCRRLPRRWCVAMPAPTSRPARNAPAGRPGADGLRAVWCAWRVKPLFRRPATRLMLSVVFRNDPAGGLSSSMPSTASRRD